MITNCLGFTFFGAPMIRSTSAALVISKPDYSNMPLAALTHTPTRRPLRLVWAQECEHIEDAYVLEHKIKGWRREKKLALISGRFSDLPQLSRSGSHKRPAPSLWTNNCYVGANRNSTTSPSAIT